MTFITLPVGSLIRFNSNALSEHNRSPLSIGYNRIEKTQRMSNGYMRKFFIADKKTINVSWSLIPSYSNYTVDGGWGALDLKSFYESAREAFPVTITRSTQTGSTTETMSMVFTSFSCDIIKRNIYSEIDYKNAKITAVTHNGTSITYTGPNNFAAGEVVSVSGFDTEIYNVSNAAVTSANANSFTVAKTGSVASVTEASSDGTKFTYYATNTFSAGDVVSVAGFANGSAYNKTNVDILSATDYYFTIADTSTQAIVVLSTPGTATLYSESTQFAITSLVPTANTSVLYGCPSHDLEIGDTVSITGIRSTATITAAAKLAGDDVISPNGTINSVKLLDNVATVSFSNTSFSTYSWNIGDSITISGCSNSVFNGAYTVTAVPSANSVSFVKTNTDIALDATATGSAVNNTWSSGMIKYTSANVFAKNDIISISGITPSNYNNTSARIAYATPTYFLVPGNITEKYRKGGSAASIFNLSNVVISAVTENNFTVPLTSATGSIAVGFTGAKVSKIVNYNASARTVATPQEFWMVSLSLEEV